MAMIRAGAADGMCHPVGASDAGCRRCAARAAVTVRIRGYLRAVARRACRHARRHFGAQRRRGPYVCERCLAAPCEVEGCALPVHAARLCRVHYERRWRAERRAEQRAAHAPGGARMRCISWFAGIGGFDLALRRAGHEVVGACEIAAFSRRVYSARLGAPAWFPEDICDVEPARAATTNSGHSIRSRAHLRAMAMRSG